MKNPVRLIHHNAEFSALFLCFHCFPSLSFRGNSHSSTYVYSQHDIIGGVRSNYKFAILSFRYFFLNLITFDDIDFRILLRIFFRFLLAVMTIIAEQTVEATDWNAARAHKFNFSSCVSFFQPLQTNVENKINLSIRKRFIHDHITRTTFLTLFFEI